MKRLRHSLVLFLCIIFAGIATGFLLPSRVHVERSMLVNASQEQTFRQVNTLKNWVKWSPWLRMDSVQQLRFSGPETGAGATCHWLGTNKKLGKGSISILASQPDDSVMLIMDFGKNGKSTGKFLFHKQDLNTKVIWCFDTDLGINPLSRWIGLFSDRMIGPDLEQGLLKLAKTVEALKTVNTYDIYTIDVPARVILSIRDTASGETISPKLALMYDTISGFLKMRGLSPAAAPIAIYHNFTGNSFDFEAGILVKSEVKTPSGINCFEIGAQKTIMVNHFGSYNLIPGAYTALQFYIESHGIQVIGPPWEEYVTDPNTEADSNKWQTNIYYPVK